MAAIGMQLAREDARRFARLEHHRAGAVAEKHAGAAVLEVEDARKDFGTNHERLAGHARADHRIGDRQRVDEARAHGLNVERSAAGDAELLLHQARGRRKHHVRRAGCDDDQVDARGIDIGGFERAPCRGHREVAAADIGLGEVACANAGALDDPLIGGFDAVDRELRSQSVVGQAFGRQEAAGAGDA